MVIQNMFVEDINRKINGVVKVDEDENKVLEQELNEYVITRELKRHFVDFFNTYAEAFDEQRQIQGSGSPVFLAAVNLTS